MSDNQENSKETPQVNGLTLSTNSTQYFDADAPPLNKEELVNAVEDLLVKIPKKLKADYPKIVRSYVDPPLSGQNYANVSMMFFDNPQPTKGGKLLYGFGKVSGAFSTEEGASDSATSLIRNVNSHNHIFVVPVGHLFPLTNDESYAKAVQDVTEDQENDKRTEEVIKKAHNEEEKIKRQLREREDELKNDNYDDVESLNYYTKQKVSRMELSRYITSGEKKMKDLRKKLKAKDKEIVQLSNRHENYQNEWVSRYNEERVRAGLDVYMPEDEKSKSSGKDEE